MTQEKLRVLVLGLGNILLSDEGFGVRVIETMQSRGVTLPSDCNMVEGGTMGFDLLNYLSEAKKVVVVDTVRGGGEPGAMYRFNVDDVGVRQMPMDSLHQINLYQVLQMSEHLGDRPDEIIVIGCEPKSIEMGLELTPEVQARIDKAIELVLKEV
jgi:hydrogenase maturation protease